MSEYLGYDWIFGGMSGNLGYVFIFRVYFDILGMSKYLGYFDILGMYGHLGYVWIFRVCLDILGM